MPPIESLNDDRLASYRNLRERTLRGESLFVAEGRFLVERLLQSPFEVESLLVSEQCAGEFAPLAGPDTPVHVARPAVIGEIVGFDFHRGVLAAGRRGRPKTLEELVGVKGPHDPLRLVVCPAGVRAENLGLIFRTAAGFGVDGVLLGPECQDPLSRRCLRLSMGATLRMPFVESDDITGDLVSLKSRWQVRLVATVLDESAQPLADFSWPRRTGLLFGAEFEGLDRRSLALCDHRLTIPMRSGTDSLNLGVAAGIFVHEMMTRGEQRIVAAQYRS